MQFQINTVVGLLSLLLVDGTKGHALTVSNHSSTFTGFDPVSKLAALCTFVPNFPTV
jgi:hypothetical protein